MFRRQAPDTPLFAVSSTHVQRSWSRARAFLRLPHDFCMYQLRDGGASEDCLSRRRTLQEIQHRGRWTTASSLKRYTKPGQVQSC